MRFLSTRCDSPTADLRTAVVLGQAPDGGLYMPETLPRLPASFFTDLPGQALADTADAMLAPFLEDLPDDVRRRLVSETLDFPIPLVEIEDGVHILELFHGPTLAFKDVGARFLARLLAHFLAGDQRPLTVLVATSGDTGSAVAQAFLGLAGTRVVVLYPRGKVSPLQEKQFTTLGENVEAVAVDGTFDDCQRLVKSAFADEQLRRELLLTSANSINIGRLLPQMVYYVHALAQLPAGTGAPLFATPSGNFGNLAAGLLATRLGMPAAGFVAATNANDVVPEFLHSGHFAPRPSVTTISNAMDVGDPSNFTRILALFDGDSEALRRVLVGSRHSDEATRAAVRDVFARTGYLLDPHTAVGYLGLHAALGERHEPVPGIVLATAHPVKFREHVEPLIGREIAVPERLARCLDRPSRARRLPPSSSALAELLTSLT